MHLLHAGLHNSIGHVRKKFKSNGGKLVEFQFGGFEENNWTVEGLDERACHGNIFICSAFELML